MSNTLYKLRLSANAVLDVRDALLHKYGAYHVTNNPTGVTIHYAQDQYVIFSCTAIADKVIRLQYSGSAWNLWYGTSYATGNTINGQVVVGQGVGTLSMHVLILGSGHFVMPIIASTMAGAFIYIGKLSNDSYVISHLVGDGVYHSLGASFDTTAGVAIQPMAYGGLTRSYRSSDCKRFRFPVTFQVTSTGVALLNSNNTLATAPNWNTLSVDSGLGGIVVLPNGVLTGSQLFQLDSFRVTYHGFWSEYSEAN